MANISLLFTILLCVLFTTPIVGSDDVVSISLTVLNDTDSETIGDVYITLWFNFMLYQYTIQPNEFGKTYTTSISDMITYCETEHFGVSDTRIMIENNNVDGVCFDKIAFHTSSGEWYGIQGRCFDDALEAVQGWMRHWSGYEGATVDDVDCESGVSNVWLCIDNQNDDLGPYKQIFYFDINRSNEYINDAKWKDGTDDILNFETCLPTPDPSAQPTNLPSNQPTYLPSSFPSTEPSNLPSVGPSDIPTLEPLSNPTLYIDPRLQEVITSNHYMDTTVQNKENSITKLDVKSSQKNEIDSLYRSIAIFAVFTLLLLVCCSSVYLIYLTKCRKVQMQTEVNVSNMVPAVDVNKKEDHIIKHEQRNVVEERKVNDDNSLSSSSSDGLWEPQEQQQTNDGTKTTPILTKRLFSHFSNSKRMAASDTKTLRAWLKKEDVFHSDLEKLFIEKGITDPEEDFKTMTRSQWDAIKNEAIVLRAKDLKSQQAKVRWEAKLKKVEKFWRKASGTKSTSIKKSSAAASAKQASLNTADSQQSLQFAKASTLKDYMRANQIFDKDLFEILVQNDVKSEDDLSTKITSNKQLDTILREVRVRRTADIKETKARQRLDKTLSKFEKIVRLKSEKLKKTSLKSGDDEKQLKEWETDKEQKQKQKEGKELKAWLQKEGIWLKELYDGLFAMGITSEFQIQCLEETEFDEIVRGVRVDRFSNVKDQTARQSVDKLLVKFEKIWRRESQIKKTSITKNTYK